MLILCILVLLIVYVKSFRPIRCVSAPKLRATSVDAGTVSKPTLPVDEIAMRYKVIQFGQTGAPGDFELENQDTAFANELIKITLSREGGLGLDLAEYSAGRGNGGVVLVNDVIEGSNAAKTGLFMPGDALVSVQAVGDNLLEGVPTGVVNVEGLNFDATIGELGRFRDCSTLTIIVKRLVTREYVTIEMVGPQGEDAGEMVIPAGYGANVRSELQRNNMKVYDPLMARFDSPYQTGDCGGEGTCGTCMIAVLAGSEFLNDRVTVESKGLAKQGAQGNYRWACRTKLRAGVNKGGKVKIMLRPQTRTW